MRKKVAFVVVALICAAFVLYGGHVWVESMRAALELDRAKTALINEARGISAEAERRLAWDWKKVANDYLTDFQRGKLDQLFDEAARDGHRRWNYGALAGETYTRVRLAVEVKLQSEGDYPITREKVSAKLSEDARIVHLQKVAKAQHEVYSCALVAADADELAEIEGLQGHYEDKKKTLVCLLVRRFDR